LKCRRSGWACPGYSSEFIFQDEGPRLRQKPVTRQGKEESRSHPSGFVEKSHSVPRFPLSLSEALRYRFCETLGDNLPAGRTLSVFGGFMIDVPLHIGLHATYDLSVEALYLAHSALFANSQRLLQQSQRLYGQALSTLQLCLSNEDQARSAETLCATVLLSIYELIVGTNETASIKHVGGAALLIQMRGPQGFKDPFSFKILSSLRSKIVSL
jgi:hypothetical protein